MTGKIAEKLNVSHANIENHLKQFGYIKKLDIPHELKKLYFTKRINISDSLLRCKQNDAFMKRMIIGDEK